MIVKYFNRFKVKMIFVIWKQILITCISSLPQIVRYLSIAHYYGAERVSLMCVWYSGYKGQWLNIFNFPADGYKERLMQINI